MNASRFRPTPTWTPVRNGSLYCSPACGGRCTFAAFDRATKDAAALAKQLGPGWEPEVFENQGWHFNAYHKGADAQVWRDGNDGQKGYNYTLFWNGVNPQIVVKARSIPALLAAAREKVEAMIEQLKKMEGVL